MLGQAVTAYNKTDNPGRFELRKDSDGHFHVIGTGARDGKGSIAKQPALLDLTLNIAVEERSITDLLKQVCDKLSTESHVPVTIGISREVCSTTTRSNSAAARCRLAMS